MNRLSQIATHIALPATLLVIAIVYLVCMSPYVGSGDAGEFVVTAYRLASPHPPGYPLYTFLAHLFTYLPISTPAWRVGLFSLVCQVAAAGVVFTLVREWLGKIWLASFVALFYSLTPLVWRYAMEAEVFALNNLFAAVLLLLLLRTLTDSQTSPTHTASNPNLARVMPLLGFLIGLASTNHLTILMFSFPFMILFLAHNRKAALRGKPLLLTVLAFAIGLLPYLYMIYLGQNRALFAWGDTTTWDGFWTHVLRAEYGSFQLATGDKEDSHFFSKLYYFAREMGLNLYFKGVFLFALALWSLLAARFFGKSPTQTSRSPMPRSETGLSSLIDSDNPSDQTRRTFAEWLLIAFTFYALVFHALSNLNLQIPLYYHTQARMWLLPLLLLSLLAGFGLKKLVEFRRFESRKGVLAYLAFVSILATTIHHWKIQDKSNDRFFEDVGLTMLNAVAPNSVILMREDVYVNALRYLQDVENIRTDVKVIPLDALWWPWSKALVEKNVPGFTIPGDVFRPGNIFPGAYTLLELLNANVDKFPLYISKIYPAEELTLRGEYIGFPYGFQSRVKRIGKEFTYDEAALESAPFLGLRMPPEESHRYESWETFVRLNYYAVKLPMGQVFLQRAAGRAEWVAKGVDILKSVEAESPENATTAREILNSISAR